MVGLFSSIKHWHLLTFFSGKQTPRGGFVPHKWHRSIREHDVKFVTDTIRGSKYTNVNFGDLPVCDTPHGLMLFRSIPKRDVMLSSTKKRSVKTVILLLVKNVKKNISVFNDLGHLK